ICCGCGACAGICCRIRMTEDRLGEYSPQFSGPCGGSGKCAEVCPMNADSRCSLTAFGEWGEKKEESIGQYADCYTVPAREEQKRENSAALAGLFRLLLSSGEADSVIYPARTEDPAKFYDYRICTDPDLLRACPGFFCFPLEISGVLRYIKNKPGKYAVAALPCGVKALRLAMMLDVVIAQRITYIIGISCLQNKSRGWLEYCSEQSRFGRDLISAELLRRTSESGEALYEYSFVYSDGSKRFVPFPKAAWKNRIHTLKGCGSCDDLFAEDADVTLIGDNPVFGIRDEMLIVRSNRIQKLVTAPESKMGLVKIEASALLEKTASQIAFDRASVFYRPERTRRRLAAFRSGNPPGFKTGLLEAVRQRLAYSSGDRRRKKALRKLTRGEEISRVRCWQDGLLHFISRWQEHRNH
ncbi:MAG TPA: Coenzyme F420 hydrogenase/dehydrogenase, beta subunit C-terminal domain, partial [Clostridia bacterium]|nr:Coenzyme F420 hydrogenase/dehydrogenase, beta subunit C-terminal domain [Clostridia bacterium]